MYNSIKNLIIGTSYLYDNKNNIIQETITITNKTLPINNTFIVECHYDTKGRLIEINTSNGHHYYIKYSLFRKKLISK